MWGGGGLDSISAGGQGNCARVILVLRPCIWNAPVVSLVLPAFKDTGSPGYPLRRVAYPLAFHPGDYFVS